MDSPSKITHLSPAVRHSILSNSPNQRRASLLNSSRASTRKRVFAKDKPEFSENVKRLARKMMFRAKTFLMMEKAKKHVQTQIDQLNPGYSRLIRVLQNGFRSTANAEFILEYLKQLSFFANFLRDLGDVDETAITELCKSVKYENMPAGSIVFQEGDPSNNKFYVILKGSVTVVKRSDGNVFVSENRKAHQELKQQKTIAATRVIDHNEKVGENVNISMSFFSNSSDESGDDEDSKGSIDQKTQNRIKDLIASFGSKLSEMKEGEGFGEKALLEKNSKRTASVVANTNCEFLVMFKKDYVDIITKFDKRRQAKIKFMNQHIPHLGSIVSSEIMANLFYLIKEIDHTKGAVIAIENSPGRNIYFIQDGYCDLEKIIISEVKTNQKAGVLKAKRKIATFGAGNCMGEEVLLSSDPKYEYTITVSSSSARLYCIEKSAFLTRFPKECIQTIIENFQSKEIVHKQKIKKISEDAQNLTLGRPQEPIAHEMDNLTQLMLPALRHSKTTLLKMNKDRDQQSKSTYFTDMTGIRPQAHSGNVEDIIKEEKHQPEIYYKRGTKPVINSTSNMNLRAFRKQNPKNDLSSGSQDSKQYIADEINIEDSPRIKEGKVQFLEEFQSLSAKRVEPSNPEGNKFARRLKAMGTYDVSLRGGNFSIDTNIPPLEKFDFGPPLTAKASSRKVMVTARHEKKTSGGNSSPKPGQEIFDNYYCTTEPNTAIKEQKNGTTIRIKPGKCFTIRMLPGNTTLIKQDGMINIKSLEGLVKMQTEETTPKIWRYEESEIKPKARLWKSKTVVAEVPVKLEIVSPNAGVKEIIKKNEDGSNKSARLTLKEKRKIHDSLNTKKQKEKVNIKTNNLLLGGQEKMTIHSPTKLVGGLGLNFYPLSS